MACAAPQVREVGYLRALARDQDEIGGVDRANRLQRKLLWIAASDADQSEREHERTGRSDRWRGRPHIEYVRRDDADAP